MGAVSFTGCKEGAGAILVFRTPPVPPPPHLLLGLNESHSVARRQNKIKKAQRT